MLGTRRLRAVCLLAGAATVLLVFCRGQAGSLPEARDEGGERSTASRRSLRGAAGEGAGGVVTYDLAAHLAHERGRRAAAQAQAGAELPVAVAVAGRTAAEAADALREASEADTSRQTDAIFEREDDAANPTTLSALSSGLAGAA